MALKQKKKSLGGITNHASGTAERISDVGKKIGGAKKDLAQMVRKQLAKITHSDLVALPKSSEGAVVLRDNDNFKKIGVIMPIRVVNEILYVPVCNCDTENETSSAKDEINSLLNEYGSLELELQLLFGDGLNGITKTDLDFNKMLLRYKRGKTYSYEKFYLGTTPAVWKNLYRLPEAKIYMGQSVLHKAIFALKPPENVKKTGHELKHGLEFTDFINMPSKLAESTEVYKSKSKSNNGFVVVVNIRDYLNHRVMLAIHLLYQKTKNNSTELCVNEVASVYGRVERQYKRMDKLKGYDKKDKRFT